VKPSTNGRSAGAAPRCDEAVAVGRLPDLSGTLLRTVRPRERGRAAGSGALAPVRQSEGQWLSRALPLPALAGEAGRPPRRARILKARIDNTLGILDKRLSSRPFVLGQRPTIADLSLVGYHYYPTDEFGFDIAAERRQAVKAKSNEITARQRGSTCPTQGCFGHSAPESGPICSL
jgi:glutathione S-transferase